MPMTDAIVRKEIVLRYVCNPTTPGLTWKFKTLHGARNKAWRIMGEAPKQDPDGYAVNRVGNCLFIVSGTSFAELFPKAGS